MIQGCSNTSKPGKHYASLGFSPEVSVNQACCSIDKESCEEFIKKYGKKDSATGESGLGLISANSSNYRYFTHLYGKLNLFKRVAQEGLHPFREGVISRMSIYRMIAQRVPVSTARRDIGLAFFLSNLKSQ